MSRSRCRRRMRSEREECMPYLGSRQRSRAPRRTSELFPHRARSRVAGADAHGEISRLLRGPSHLPGIPCERFKFSLAAAPWTTREPGRCPRPTSRRSSLYTPPTTSPTARLMSSNHSPVSTNKMSPLWWLTLAASLLVSPLAQGQPNDVSVTVELYTRSAYSAIIVFHPDDVAHRSDNPMHWLRESFAYGPETAEGRILAFTSEIMGVVRLTTEGLSEREQRWRGHPWTFRYQVRHGRVFVGTEDSLQYVDSEREGLYGTLLPEGGFALANGAYAVDVYPINWEAEPGGRTSDGKRTADALPEFVVLFKPVKDLREIVETLTPVYFPPFLDGKPSPAPEPMSSMWVQGQHE